MAVVVAAVGAVVAVVAVVGVALGLVVVVVAHALCSAAGVLAVEAPVVVVA